MGSCKRKKIISLDKDTHGDTFFWCPPVAKVCLTIFFKCFDVISRKSCLGTFFTDFEPVNFIQILLFGGQMSGPIPYCASVFNTLYAQCITLHFQGHIRVQAKYAPCVACLSQNQLAEKRKGQTFGFTILWCISTMFSQFLYLDLLGSSWNQGQAHAWCCMPILGIDDHRLKRDEVWVNTHLMILYHVPRLAQSKKPNELTT